MAKHEIKCKVCGRTFDTNGLIENVDWIKISNRYAHKKCYDDFLVNKDKPNSNFTADDIMYRDAAYEYMRRDLLITVDFKKFASQWNSLLKKGKTSKGIYFAIRYFYEVEKGDKTKAQGGIGIVDYVYNRSCQYWAEKERNGEHILAQIEAQVRALQDREVIEVKRNPKKKKNKKVIDLSLIEEME